MSSNISHSQLTEKEKNETPNYPELANLELPKDMIHAMINEAFLMFDEDQSGDIDKKEFTNLIKSINPDVSKNKINEMMKKVDNDGSGKIDKAEFTEMMMSQIQTLHKEGHEKSTTKKNEPKKSPVTINLELVFNLYDKNMDSRIDYKDFVESSKDLGDNNPLDSEEGKILVEIAKYLWKESHPEDIDNDPSHKDSISQKEFLNLLLKLKFVERSQDPLVGISDKKTDGFEKSASRISVN